MKKAKIKVIFQDHWNDFVKIYYRCICQLKFRSKDHGLANSKEDYNDIADEIYSLREEKHNALAEEAEKKAVTQRLTEMKSLMSSYCYSICCFS